jgi:hypothetical protein
MVGIDEPETSDTLTVVTPAIDGSYLGRHNWVGFGYTGSFSLYHQLNDLNSYDQHLRLDTRHALSKRLTLSLYNTFAASPTTDALMITGLPFVRTGSLLDDGGARLSIAASAHTTVTAGYGFTWVSFDAKSPYTGLLRGGTSHRVSGSLSHELSRRWSVGGEGSYERSLIARLGEGVGIVQTSATASYDATPTLSVSAALGISRVGHTIFNASRIGPAWRLSAVQQFKRATLTAGWSQSFVPSFSLGGSFQNRELDVALAMPVARNRLYWQGGLSWRASDPLLEQELTLHSLWLQTSVGYSVHRRVRIEAYYARSAQDSLRPGGKIDRNTFGVQVVTSKPMRIK